MTPGSETMGEGRAPGNGGAADEVTCRQFVELITDYLGGEVEPALLSLIEEHLVMCDWCVDYTDQMRATVAELARLREPDVEPGAPSEALLAALRARRGGGA
jgi:predicted anti-sigma-YlaC factor YlaD